MSLVNSESALNPTIKLSDRFRTYLPVVIDIETGGFNAKTDAILEISAVMLTMDKSNELIIDQSFFSRVIPFEGANIEESALKFTGIDPYHPMRIAKPEKEVFRTIFKIVRESMKVNTCNRAILVAHNSHFDHGFINAAAARHNLKRNPFHPFSSFDTASLGGLAYGQTVLSRACEAAGIEFEDNKAHSANYDAEKTAQLFCGIVNKWQELGGWPISS